MLLPPSHPCLPVLLVVVLSNLPLPESIHLSPPALPDYNQLPDYYHRHRHMMVLLVPILTVAIVIGMIVKVRKDT